MQHLLVCIVLVDLEDTKGKKNYLLVAELFRGVDVKLLLKCHVEFITFLKRSVLLLLSL